MKEYKNVVFDKIVFVVIEQSDLDVLQTLSLCVKQLKIKVLKQYKITKNYERNTKSITENLTVELYCTDYFLAPELIITLYKIFPNIT